MPSTKPRQKTWIPGNLQQFFGNRTSYSEHVTPGDNRAVRIAKRAAELRHHALFDRVHGLPDDVKAMIIAKGGDVLKLRDHVDVLREMLGRMPTTQDILFKRFTAPPALEALIDSIPGPAGNGDGGAVIRMAIVQQRRDMETELAALEPVALSAEPASEFTFDGLFRHWAKGGAKAPRHYEATAKLLTACYGNVDYRSLRPATKDGWKFADWLSEQCVGPASQDNHLGRARAMYKAAERHLQHVNPFERVKATDVHHAQDRGKFTRAQLRAILAKAEAVRFGDNRVEKRHAQTVWLLRLAIYTGARINELASLRKGDVLVHQDGDGTFPFLYFRADAVKAKAGEDRSRKVPLHPEIADAFLAYVKTTNVGFLFHAFPDGGVDGRASWMVSNFPAFLREHAGDLGIELRDGINPKTRKPVKVPVDADGRPLTLHSIRHSFHVAVSTARLHADSQRVLVGHAGRDVHDRVYNSGPEFHLLAADMALVRPL